MAQYAPQVAAGFGNLKTVPDEYLLWFHHVPWDYAMHSGRTLWEELVQRYTRGVTGPGAANGFLGFSPSNNAVPKRTYS